MYVNIKTGMFLLLCFACEIIIPDCASAAWEEPTGKPFKRAMIFSGLALDFTAYIGLYDAAVDNHCEPDLIIATSGGAVAAAIIAAYPDKAERLKYLESEEFFDFLNSVTIEEARPAPYLAQLVRWFPRKYGLAPLTPDLFARPLASLPPPAENNSFNIPFPTRAKGPRIILIAGRMDYTKGNALRPGRKLFTETWFTDALTGAFLEGFNSPVATRYPRCSIACPVSVEKENLVADGLKASIAEPHLLVPTCVDGKWYTGGAIDLWPVELAASLAEETVLPKLGNLTRIVETIFGSVFQYSNRKRLQDIEKNTVATRVDMEDNREAMKEVSFWFNIRLDRMAGRNDTSCLSHRRSSSGYLIPRPRIYYKGPKDYDDVLYRVGVQYEYGYRCGQKSLGS